MNFIKTFLILFVLSLGGFCFVDDIKAAPPTALTVTASASSSPRTIELDLEIAPAIATDTIIYQICYKSSVDANFSNCLAEDSVSSSTINTKDNGSFNGTVLSFSNDFTNLSLDGITYQFKLIARKDGEATTSSSTSLAIFTNPGTPTIKSFDQNETDITLDWDKYIVPTGATVYRFASRLDSSSGDYDYEYVNSGAYTYKLSGLNSHTAYRFQIRACNTNLNQVPVQGPGDDTIGCSAPLVKVIGTEEVENINNSREDYIDGNKRYRKKLEKYNSKITNKLTILASSTLDNFRTEIQAIISELDNTLALVNSSTDNSFVVQKNLELNDQVDMQVDLIKEKFKVYSYVNSFYKKFSNFQSKASEFNQIQDVLGNLFIDHLASSTNYYREEFEKEISSVKLPSDIYSAGASLERVKVIKENIKHRYKITNKIYRTIKYVDSVIVKFDGYREYSDSENKNYFKYIFGGGNIGVQLKDDFNVLIADYINIYKETYISNASSTWDVYSENDYDNINNAYKEARKDGRKKSLAVAISGLKSIDGMMEKTTSYRQDIDTYFFYTDSNGNQFPSLSATVRNNNFFDQINVDLVIGLNPPSYASKLIDLENNDPYEIRTNARKYSTYKSFVYFYRGAKYVDKLTNKVVQLENILDNMKALNSNVTKDTSYQESLANKEHARQERDYCEEVLEKMDTNLSLDAIKELYKDFKGHNSSGLKYYKKSIYNL